MKETPQVRPDTGAAGQRFIPDIPPPLAATRAPRVGFPAGACDCHAHVFGPPEWARLLPDTHFRPHECPLPDYLRMLGVLGVQRAVLVQPSVYGTDNALIAEALRQPGFELRGVAVVDPDISTEELQAMHLQGFRGIRVNTASATPGLRLHQVPALADRIRPLGWHLQFFVDLQRQPELADQLAGLDIPIVIDHFGKVPASGGLDSPAARALLRLLALPHCWAKLMGPYFISSEFPQHPDVDALAQAMVALAPDRLLWGTDWPHPSARHQMPNDGDLADMLARWVPDSAARHRILVTNPARLYGF
jgi:predicted TIM-barrel fold metal-dependent hydrolase